MGWILGLGNGVVFRTGSSMAWSSYWTHQSEVLFFGLYSEISGGQMPNKVDGGATFLTVAGSAGSETYQAPDTAPYQTADTDYIWFKTDVSQRTTTTAELIGYDFTRTIVKYDNTAPYAIEAIMILKSDVDTAKMRDDFDLSVWWSNVLSAHGNVKGNRGVGRSIWTAESIMPATITDTNKTAAWYDSQDLTTITFASGVLVEKWECKAGTGHDLIQIDITALPAHSSNGITFDGINDTMQAGFTYNQPITIYLVLQQLSWKSAGGLIDGVISSTCLIQQNTSTPGLIVYAGGASALNNNLTIGTTGIIRIKFNGASGKFQINNTPALTGNYGASNTGGITIGRQIAGAYGHLMLIEAIYRKVDDSVDDETAIYNYLAHKYGLELI